MTPCNRGVAAFLAEQQSLFRNKKLAYSLIGGSLASGILYVAESALKLNLKWWEIGIPFAAVVVGGVGLGTFGADKKNAESIAVFNSMCGSR
mgnify:CR=1 FL=1|tara:strand:- start:437 stop:712 length:276 start_codon:yes stop_codon:yes gene_type:complete